MPTMLFALLLAMGAFQDAPETTTPAPGAPEAAPQTSEMVRGYLMEAESLLYDPQKAGLASLAFDVDVDLPTIGKVGTVHVSWAAGTPVTATITANDALELPPQVPAEAVRAGAIENGKQVLVSMLNRPLSSLLETGVATMAAPQDGLVVVNVADAAAAAGGVKAQSYHFDEDNTLRRSVIEMEQQTPMGALPVKVTSSYVWRKASETNEALLMDRQETLTDIAGGMMRQTSQTQMLYATFGEITIPTRITNVMELPGMGKHEQVLAVVNLVVNGQPAPTGERAPAAGG